MHLDDGSVIRQATGDGSGVDIDHGAPSHRSFEDALRNLDCLT